MGTSELHRENRPRPPSAPAFVHNPGYSPEMRERASGWFRSHRGEDASEWAALVSISAKIGCNAETLRTWVRQSQRDEGGRAGVTTAERDRLKALEREVRELRQAKRSCAKASAYFAAVELDRRFTP